MGDGASKARGGLGFGPIIRYVQLDPKRVQRSNWDSFVADCLHEMRYAGIPCWTWLSYVLAIWVWIAGRFATGGRTLMCAGPTIVITIAMYFFFAHSGGK